MSAGRPLVITHVITRLIVGGAQENTVATVLGVAAKPGFHTHLISGPERGPEGALDAEFARSPGVLTLEPSLIRAVRPVTDAKAVFALRRILRAQKPDIVHTHSGKAGIVGRWAARLEHVPLIIHGIHGPSFGSWQAAIPNLVFRGAERAAGKVTDHFVAVANAMIEQYLAAGIGRPEMYTRILSGFPLEPFLQARNDQSLRAELGIEKDDFVVGKIARLFELKGHDDLFAIAPAFVKAHPNTRFLLVGGGPWEERFRKQAADLGLHRNFIFTGLVPPAKIPSLVGIMDVLVHLSLREGLPRALPQALAAGKPVIAYDCDGAGEVCLHEQTGLLVPRQDRAALLAAMNRLAADPVLAAELGAAGRAMVRENFSVEKMVEDTASLYQRLFSRRFG